MESHNYILGTDTEELERLKFQHTVWQPYVQKLWQAAGISIGHTIIDMGAGPGFASYDLAEMVRKKGRVVALERSDNYFQYIKEEIKIKNLSQITAIQLDLMAEEMPSLQADFIWCRWVACFVNDVQKLIDNAAKMLKPGGKIIFNEYTHYETYRLIPASPLQEEFVQKVLQSWRDNGGEPNIARQLPEMLRNDGFEIIHTQPRCFAARPNELIWHWPASYLRIGSKRLVELGYQTSQWAAAIEETIRNYEADTQSIFITPMVLEIIAQKKI